MDGRGNHGESVAIIGMACRFPGARDPAEFHDLAVAGRGMFQPAAALPGRPLQAAVLEDWSVPQIPAAGPAASEGTLASRPVVACVPRMRCAEEADPSGPAPPGRCAARGGKPGPFGNLTG